eukprot:scaffold1179_cov118-Isochrysis_galbana.AAC.8
MSTLSPALPCQGLGDGLNTKLSATSRVMASPGLPPLERHPPQETQKRHHNQNGKMVGGEEHWGRVNGWACISCRVCACPEGLGGVRWRAGERLH